MAEAPVVEHVAGRRAVDGFVGHPVRPKAAVSLRAAGQVIWDHRLVFAGILGGLLLACLAWCLIAPKQYEAKARLALRIAPPTTLSLDAADGAYSGNFASGQTQLETLAGVFRSDELAWRVIVDLKLYQAPAFNGRFGMRLGKFNPDAPSPEARAYLLERFQDRLNVRTVPRTLLLELRFRSGDAALSASVVNTLIRTYEEQDSQARILATAKASGWLEAQLGDVKMQADRDDQRLAEFQRQHGILIAPESPANGQGSAAQHLSALLEVDEMGRELVAASSERILREADYRAASQGDPETVLASDPRLQNESGGLSISAFRLIHQRRSDLEQELAQLSAEHGPNFPRAVEIRQQLDDLDRQKQAEDEKLRERFRSAWQTAVDREAMVRKGLEERTEEGRQAADSAVQYEAMRREADASRELYLRMKNKAEEAALAAGVHGSDFWVVDSAHAPAKPAAPDLPLYMAITLFAGLWLAAGGAFLMETLRPANARILALLFCAAIFGITAHAQAPTPSTSGLPTGVARIPGSPDSKNVPNPSQAPPVWNGTGTPPPGMAGPGVSLAEGPFPGPIVPGDMLDISEFHIPEFHSTVRVSAGGTVSLPLIGDITVSGLDEPAAAHAIAAELMDKGILFHPQVSVLITAYVGRDVTVMGEVARPGVYPYGIHHRLLDLISAASGLNVTAGSLVRVTHRDDSAAPVLLTLDFSQSASPVQNPELQPGDMVQVTRSGLVYVVGDVNRPGGFTMETSQQMTVLQAISLAWGPSQNAALQKALLIHEEKSGRTVTTLNLKRMLRGQDPDMPMNERDILFVPDSAAKNLWNRTMESVVQSAAGVSIYAGLVYSQRF